MRILSNIITDNMLRVVSVRTATKGSEEDVRKKTLDKWRRSDITIECAYRQNEFALPREI